MKIKIIALGKIKEKFLKDGIDEFLKRLTPYSSVDIVELTPVEIKDENLIQKVLLQEGERILANIKPDSFVLPVPAPSVLSTFTLETTFKFLRTFAGA